MSSPHMVKAVMTNKIVRVDQETYEALHELVKQRWESMQRALAYAVEAFRRQYVLEKANAVYANLKASPGVWREEEAERREWDATLSHGLDEG
jgi:hypothetical protein